ncbi:hypothetical protein SAMN05216210_1665 [Halopseudomonas salegens]|uniref:Uncharacterized protein n=1 Tax=Halopseudomonas salegens TaxID=1434072 RepID=A0A1H2FMA0_9GAMM|nr:hypothetical protein SAMN05216210_1665 [Halopseudomonas salegens]
MPGYNSESGAGNSVAALMLGAVQRLVSPLKQFIKRLILSPHLAQPNTYRNAQISNKPAVFNRLADFFGHSQRIRLRQSFRQQQRKLLTTISSQHISHPYLIVQNPSQFAQYLIAQRMAMHIIHLFEVINIQNQTTERPLRALKSVPQLHQLLIKGTPVGNAGKRILSRQLLKPKVGRRQLPSPFSHLLLQRQSASNSLSCCSNESVI